MSLRSVTPTRRATPDKLMLTVAQHTLDLRAARPTRLREPAALLSTLRDDVGQAQDDAVVVLRFESALFTDANLRGGNEIAVAGTRRVQIEQDEAEVESGSRCPRSGHRDWLGGD